MDQERILNENADLKQINDKQIRELKEMRDSGDRLIEECSQKERDNFIAKI